MVYPETIEVSETKRMDKHANLLLTPFEFYKFIQTEGFKSFLIQSFLIGKKWINFLLTF